MKKPTNVLAKLTSFIQAFITKLKTRLGSNPNQKLLALGFIAFFAIIGTYFLLATKAAGPFASLEPEQGTGLTALADPSASGGAYVQFGLVSQPSSGICTSRSAPTADAPYGGVPTDKFPGAACTGVPAGVTLQNVSANFGPYYLITADNTTIDSKNITANVCISASNVTIKNSRVKGALALGCDDQSRPGNLTLIDVEMDGQNDSSDGIGYFPSVKCLRCNIHDVSKGISGADFQLIDSWIHDLYGEGTDPATWSHNETILVSGGNALIKHNNLDGRFSATSTGGGMSATIAIYSHGHWGPVDNVTVDGNYISGGGVYCVYGGDSADYDPSNIQYINNTFEYPPKCDGPVTGWYSGNGNVWSNNKYTNGAPVNL
jgi:hypothetical protein